MISTGWVSRGLFLLRLAAGELKLHLTLEIVRRPHELQISIVLPAGGIAGRTLSWITRHRRTVRDYERLPARHETCIYWSMIVVMTRRLARQPADAHHEPPGFQAGTYSRGLKPWLPHTAIPGFRDAFQRLS